MKKLIAILTLLLATIASFAQREIKGTVVDDNGEPLIGATVKSSDSNGTVTDLDGNFKINVDEKVKALTVSYIGYKTRTVKTTQSDSCGCFWKNAAYGAKRKWI